MPVLKLVVAYDGTGFHGWARQPRLRTVEGVLEAALARVAGSVPRLSAAGRTDAGVHASGQVVSFEAGEELGAERVQRALNGMLSPEVVVVAASRAPRGFDARRSASAREYVYRIETGPVPSPFTARFVWHRPGQLSSERMRAAASHLLGEHDFASFCRPPKDGSHTVRTLRELSPRARGGRVEIRATADGFLHQMVRSLVGTLVRVGEGRVDPEAVPEILGTRSRTAAGPIAPPHGLTLVRVRYRPPSRVV